jgi:mercuric ion transport protein
MHAPTQLAEHADGATATGERWFAVGGLVGAMLASSCCVFPLIFVFAGVSGAWIGNLTALEPYKPLFAAFALANIGFGFSRVYLQPKPACAAKGACATKPSRTLTKIALWLGLLFVLVALTTDWWAPLFY